MIEHATDMIPEELLLHSEWANTGPSHHLVQFYEADTYLLSAVRNFIGLGLRAGEGVVVIATPEHALGFEEALQAEGLDVPALRASGQYVDLNASEMMATFMLNAVPDAARFSEIVGGIITRTAKGRPGVRIFGEMVSLLWSEGNQAAALRLEALWEELHRTHNFSLCCGYPMHLFAGESQVQSLRDVCRHHSQVIPAESYSSMAGKDDRSRAIALLQQKAASLQAEIEQRKQAEDALSRSLRLRDDFLSAVSHDLKTPLTVLQGQAQLLKRRATKGTLDDESLMKGLEQIDSRSRLMAELVNDLIDVTRLRAGEDLQLDLRPIDLIALVRDVIKECEADAPAHTIVLQTPETELVGRWDRMRLRRVVENLVSNAIKYSPRGGEIELNLVCEPDRLTTCAVLTVRDHGVGIPQDDVPHIFEPFYCGRNASRGIVGSGLGLSGSKQIVEQHGGSISLESAEGEGSAFTLRLPI